MRLAEHHWNPSAEESSNSIVWEECPCLLCGSDHSMPFLEAADSRRKGGLRFLIVKCQHCGLCFTNPRPNLQSMRQFYPADYLCHQKKQSASKKRFWKKDPLSKWLPLQGKSRLLDFGCGAGDFLERMHALGWNVTGLDVASAAVQIVRQKRGLTAHVGTLPQPTWPDGSFEAITMWQSLEHTHQPLAVLRDAFRLLTPGGKLFVTVPNIDSLSSSWFGSNWYGLDLPRHLTHFCSETLIGMLQRANFESMVLRQEAHSSWIRHSARLAENRRPGTATKWLHTRLGSSLAAWWGRWNQHAESLLVVATKSLQLAA
jgi:2-polyprenyl-3-methyl-5-hydroxy-6-metoxy-1,4-benzoquinol methylase